ncbi:BMP family protein [Kamptonema animale CS-326]|jgi:basic membrane protein A|uniref:BMP family protein n=1 Tax=Kamptonema animale TaxID=92934 RepID=UPI00232AB102|nr:BMP family protein [Kamptonema animale]MDB9511793.1 BMP family protein [Kamptonema animale CS-326]
MKINFRLVAIFILSALFAISCNSSVNNVAPTSQAPAASNFKVAVVLPRDAKTDDWSKSGYEGLQAIKQQLGATIDYRENVDVPSPQPPAVFEKVFREYAKTGYDLIIGHGGQFIPTIETIAQEFPRTKFAALGGTYSGNNKNFASLGFRAGEAGYVLGVAAALASKTNKIAFIGGERVGELINTSKFYEKGAKATNSQVTVSISYVESWTDEVKAKQLTEAAIKSGVDVIVANAGKPDTAIIKLADSLGVKVIGTYKDVYDLAPKAVLTSYLYSVPVLYVQAATLIRQGRWEGKGYRFGMKEKAIDFAPFRGQLTSEQEAKVNAVKQDILLGKIEGLL